MGYWSFQRKETAAHFKEVFERCQEALRHDSAAQPISAQQQQRVETIDAGETGSEQQPIRVPDTSAGAGDSVGLTTSQAVGKKVACGNDVKKPFCIIQYLDN